MKDIELPTLPDLGSQWTPYWTKVVHAQMQSYARAAVEADRAQRVPDGWKQEAAEAIDWLLNNIRRDAPQLSGKAMGNAVRVRDALLASTPAPAQQEPDCPRCKGSGEDPEGYFDQSRGPDGDTYDWPCRDCAGTGAAQRQEPPQQERKPMTEEQDRALCEAYCNAASDEYFKARPQLDSDVNRRIFYAGHRKAWIEWQTAHGIKE